MAPNVHGLEQLPLPLDGEAVAAPPLFVRHPRARRYVIRVLRDGTVRVTIPRGGSRHTAQAFLAREEAWVAQMRQRWAQEVRDPATEPSPEVVRAWRLQAVKELPARLLELAASFGLTVGRISIRNQRGRWGSCSARGHICLNWRLVRMPGWVRDYVLIHELMHLQRMDHSAAFWRLVARACPEFRAARIWLRVHGRSGG